ncbi:MAG: copper resistance protein CopC [Herbiconiux sp.]|uniref:copper resistance CopC family protein n=1 Tax=Herbiconiux sp. TaxID=1871186 RepID=UPI00121EDFD5|nr:copper resistance CopC family protein [Herbiconiux sp.]TAJ49906.1 MAG: copper resistance protein CopC [Herbiconiux sp.]
MRTLPSLAVLTVALAAVILAPAVAASAHDGLESATPAADSSITADPGAVTLGFSDQLLALGADTNGFALQVVDADGLHFESGCVAISGAQLTSPMALGGAGSYVVLWQVVSSDGHPTSGQYEFDYEPTSLEGAADGLTDAPVCGDAWAGEPDGDPTPTATSDASVVPAPTSTSGAAAAGVTDAPDATSVPRENAAMALPWPVAVLIVVVGIGVLAAIIVLVVRRMRGGGYGQ